jgi:hypothetical protein
MSMLAKTAMTMVSQRRQPALLVAVVSGEHRRRGPRAQREGPCAKRSGPEARP